MDGQRISAGQLIDEAGLKELNVDCQSTSCQLHIDYATGDRQRCHETHVRGPGPRTRSLRASSRAGGGDLVGRSRSASAMNSIQPKVTVLMADRMANTMSVSPQADPSRPHWSKQDSKVIEHVIERKPLERIDDIPGDVPFPVLHGPWGRRPTPTAPRGGWSTIHRMRCDCGRPGNGQASNQVDRVNAPFRRPTGNTCTSEEHAHLNRRWSSSRSQRDRVSIFISPTPSPNEMPRSQPCSLMENRRWRRPSMAGN